MIGLTEKYFDIFFLIKSPLFIFLRNLFNAAGGVSTDFVTCADFVVLAVMGMAVSKDFRELQASLAEGLLVELFEYLYYLVFQQLVSLHW